ncbi:hypothetical protein ACWDV6_50455, partial [Rhodococcus koreensis]
DRSRRPQNSQYPSSVAVGGSAESLRRVSWAVWLPLAPGVTLGREIEVSLSEADLAAGRGRRPPSEGA